MPDDFNLLDAIKAFVERPQTERAQDRIEKFMSNARKKDAITDVPVFEKGQDREKFDVVLDFFAPVGHRSLFEEEIVLLMNERMSYESIINMPVHLRKKLVEKKVSVVRGREPAENDALFEQVRRMREAGATIPQ